jgi:CRP/FNR family transcriptional regulator, cyclic AMP receptor protein
MSLLAEIKVFKTLPHESLRRLEQGGMKIDPRDGAQIFSQGDPADAIYAIIGGDGHVRIGSGDRRGKRLMVEVFRAGDLFGEIGVMDGGLRTAGAYAEGRTSLLQIKGSAFLALLAEQPSLGKSLCQVLANRLRRTFMLMEDATFESLEVRLARQILYLADLESRHTPNGVRVAGRFRQADLADLLGTTPRSIITILNHWRAAGTIHYDTQRAQVTLRDETALRRLILREEFSERTVSLPRHSRLDSR